MTFGRSGQVFMVRTWSGHPLLTWRLGRSGSSRRCARGSGHPSGRLVQMHVQEKRCLGTHSARGARRMSDREGHPGSCGSCVALGHPPPPAPIRWVSKPSPSGSGGCPGLPRADVQVFPQFVHGWVVGVHASVGRPVAWAFILRRVGVQGAPGRTSRAQGVQGAGAPRWESRTEGLRWTVAGTVVSVLSSCA
jgi:hypothetical protein